MTTGMRKWLEKGLEIAITGLGAAISTAIAAAISDPEKYKLGSGEGAKLILTSFIVGAGLKLGQWLTMFHFNGNGKAPESSVPK
jgi:hypothetical protein